MAKPAALMARLVWAMIPKLKGLDPWLSELAQFASESPLGQRRRVAERLLKQVHYFAKRVDALPEWRDAAKVSDPTKLWELWPSLPILTKSDLRARFDPRGMQARLGSKGLVSSTGGSTGEPIWYLHDPAMLKAKMAQSLYCRLAFGWRPGMAMIKVWGSERDIGRSRSARGLVGGYLRGDWLIDGYNLDDATVDAVLYRIGKHNPVAIWGFSSMLAFVARRLLERGDAVVAGSVRTAWNGGEMLHPQQSTVFEQAFGVPILNLYGGRELGAMGYQAARGSPLLLLRPLSLVEVVDDEGRPVGPGETGRLIVTSTVCRGTPFLRYDIGDLGSYTSECVDESGITAIHELRGRHAGVLKLPNGKTIHCLYWNHLFKEFLEIREFQVAVKGDGERLELRLRGTGFSQNREIHLRGVIAGLLEATPLSIVWVDRIPRTKQGKLEQVVRES